MKSKNLNQKSKGFTLLETLVAMSIFVLITLAVSNFVIQGYRTYTFSEEQSLAINNAREGIETMVLELREAGDSNFGEYSLPTAESQELIFYSDIDADAQTERIHYYLDGTNFKKGTAEPGANSYPLLDEETIILSQYVQNGSSAIFTYYDSSNNVLTMPQDLNQIKLIKVYLEINVDVSRAPKNFNLESMVQIRNLKDNL